MLFWNRQISFDKKEYVLSKILFNAFNNQKYKGKKHKTQVILIMERQNIMKTNPLIKIPKNWNLTEEQLWNIFKVEQYQAKILKNEPNKEIR